MQTPKARTSSTEGNRKSSPRATSQEVPRKSSPRATSIEVPQKTSPRTVSSEGQPKVSPRVVRRLKTNVHDPDSASPSSKTPLIPKEKSPKVSEPRALRSSVSHISEQKKRPSRTAELESQISELEGELQTVKDQLISSESWRKQALEDAEESKNQLLALTEELKESQKHLSKPSTSEEIETIEVHHQSASEKQDENRASEKQDKNRASEKQDENSVFDVEDIKEQHFVDSVTLATAIHEIEKLKYQLEMVAESEASQNKHAELAQSELHSLTENLEETLVLMGDVKDQLQDSKESEAHAKSIISETLVQLETAKRTVETLRSDGMKSMEAYDAIASELLQSRAHVNALEDLVKKFKSREVPEGSPEELESVKSALEAAEIRYRAEQDQREEEMRIANELIEELKDTSSQRENELEVELKKSRMEIENLKANLMDKETELQAICEENEFLNTRLKSVVSGEGEHDMEKLFEKSRAEIESLKACLMEKETELQNISDENEMLKSATKKEEVNLSEMDTARAAEREALMKVGYMQEEVDKSNRKAIRVAEQLDATQAAKAEVEAELRRLKVQADQWRKAAEAAASILSSGNNGKYVERTGSMDSPYNPRTGKVGSPYSEDVEEELLKRKNPNMLKKIGVLWKKPQK